MYTTIQLIQEDEGDSLIQMINPEEEGDFKPGELKEELAILPIKNTVLFPGVVIPITVGRQKSIKLVKRAYQGNRIIGVVAQKTLKPRSLPPKNFIAPEQ